MAKKSATPYYYHRPGEQSPVSRPAAFVVVLIFAVILGWLTVRESFLPLDGIRGVATEVSPAHTAIVLDKAKILGDGRFSFDGIKRFTVLWNRDTLFFAYPDRSALTADAPLSVNTSSLHAGQNLIVLPREKAGNVITALEVRILPE